MIFLILRIVMLMMLGKANSTHFRPSEMNDIKFIMIDIQHFFIQNYPTAGFVCLNLI